MHTHAHTITVTHDSLDKVSQITYQEPNSDTHTHTSPATLKEKKTIIDTIWTGQVVQLNVVAVTFWMDVLGMQGGGQETDNFMFDSFHIWIHKKYT